MEAKNQLSCWKIGLTGFWFLCCCWWRNKLFKWNQIMYRKQNENDFFFFFVCLRKCMWIMSFVVFKQNVFYFFFFGLCLQFQWQERKRRKINFYFFGRPLSRHIPTYVTHFRNRFIISNLYLVGVIIIRFLFVCFFFSFITCLFSHSIWDIFQQTKSVEWTPPSST